MTDYNGKIYELWADELIAHNRTKRELEKAKKIIEAVKIDLDWMEFRSNKEYHPYHEGCYGDGYPTMANREQIAERAMKALQVIQSYE